jgi:hypothetical protein
VPIIYHDWTIHDEKYEVPLSLVSSDTFKKLKKRLEWKERSKQSYEESSHRLTRALSLESSKSYLPSDTESALNLAIQTPYATLEEAFKVSLKHDTYN